MPPTEKCDNLSRFDNAHYLPSACGVFMKKGSAREDCAEGYWVYYYIYPIYELSANIITRCLDGRCNSIVFALIQCDIRRGGGYLRWIDFDGRTYDAWHSRL